MMVQLRQVHVPVDFRTKADKINNKPIAELVKKILNVQDELQDRLEKQLSKKNKISWIQSGYSHRFVSFSLSTIMGLGVAALVYGTTPLGGSLMSIGGGLSYMIESRSSLIDEIDYEISELDNQNEYIHSTLNLLDEFDKTDSFKTREDLVKKIWIWNYCQNLSTPILVEDIFWVLQSYLAPDCLVRTHFATATDQSKPLHIRRTAWGKLEEEMNCGFSRLKVNDTYFNRPQ